MKKGDQKKIVSLAFLEFYVWRAFISNKNRSKLKAGEKKYFNDFFYLFIVKLKWLQKASAINPER